MVDQVADIPVIQGDIYRELGGRLGDCRSPQSRKQLECLERVQPLGQNTIERYGPTLIVWMKSIMIDRTARDEALKVLDSMDANLTNWKLEEQWPKSDSDAALNCILRWLWSIYNDDSEVLVSDILSTDSRSVLERIKQFLKSDVEFQERQLSAAEARTEIHKWGREWRPGCTLPDYPEWPFPRNHTRTK